MAADVSIYDQFPKVIKDGTVFLTTDPIRAALVTSSYSYSAAHTQWADASSAELADASYSQKTIANFAITNAAIDADDITWPSLTGQFRQMIIYANVTRNGLTDPLLLRYLLDNTPANIILIEIDYVVRFNASGIIAHAVTSSP